MQATGNLATGDLIVADENIPYVEEAFGPFGEVRTVSGRAFTPELVRGAGVLLVRSVTEVGRGLLDGSRVRFVGSTTIGTDHVDQVYLAERGIAFANAPGSNALSVVEYVLASLVWAAVRRGETLRGKTAGVIGHGNIGRRLAARLPALGMRVLVNDPPLAEAGNPLGFVSLEEVLVESDILTLHVPLEKTGPYATRHLIGAEALRRMKPGAWVVNSCRGAVVDNPALREVAKAGGIGPAILDVWEGEPEPDAELLSLTAVATPHIAGYSFDGKVEGTVMVYRRFLDHFGLAPAWDPEAVLSGEGVDDFMLAPAFESLSETEYLHALVQQMYDIAGDDERIRAMGGLPPAERGAYFNRLRKEYPRRRTFERFSVPEHAVPPVYREAVRSGLLVRLT